MQKPILSFCIPTYNRADYLDRTLVNLAEQIEGKNIEIVVSDNCSEDNTQETIKKFKINNPKIKLVYKRQNRNLFLDRNILQSVNMASGKYVWLFSDDDFLYEGSIEKIISTLKKKPKLSLIHVNYSRFDAVIKRVTADRMVELDKDIHFRDANKFYFRKLKNSHYLYLGTNVITMTSDIVNKDLWDKHVSSVRDFIDHNFIHCFVMAKIVIEQPNVQFIAKPLVRYTSNNHRIWRNDIWNDYNKVFIDYLIDIGYNKKKALTMRKDQKSYEEREALLKIELFRKLLKNFPIIISLITYVEYLYKKIK